jgi:thiol-disulfide isomerase/thioredoxin
MPAAASTPTRRRALVVSALALLGAGTGAPAFLARAAAGEKRGIVPMPTMLSPLPAEGPMPPLDGAVEWLNSKPLSTANLLGKVVLVEFWTYSCINWQRTLPHVRAWADKYRDQGLVVIGVHTPEFGFEKDIGNIRDAAAQLKVDFPIAVDSREAIWRAFDNNYWPALYFVDARGTIRHHHFGEGAFERSEQVLQQLLTDAGAKGIDGGLVHVEGSGSQAEADWANQRSPETYLGVDRAESFASPGGAAAGKQRLYAAPESLRLNAWALAGEWTIGRESARLEAANGRIVYRFHARDLHLVMGPTSRSKPVPFRILVDGQPPGAAHGADVDAAGRGALVEHRLYQLVRQPNPVIDRRFEIEFSEPGAEVFVFTFG